MRDVRGDRGSELTDPDRIDVLRSDMPFLGPNVISQKVVRCARCSMLWDPVRLEWIAQPEGIEERK